MIKLYDVVFRPGKDNPAADTVSQRYCHAASDSTLQQLHNSLCHPGVTRMNHFVKSQNLPYSLEKIKRMISNCQVRTELKPKFYQSQGTPIKATQPFE